VLHAGDATGREIASELWTRVSALKSVETANHPLVTGLLVESGRVVGVRFYDQLGFPRDALARATLLATGGAGRVFRETTNPPVATGDGVALAFHAGARVADLEFVQFHPTALAVPGAPRFLISEALRGEGGRLINGRGQAFMQRYHPDGICTARWVARSIKAREMTGGSASLSHLTLITSSIDFDYRRYVQEMRPIRAGPDPVGPRPYHARAVSTRISATSIPGLLPPRVACTGVHGATVWRATRCSRDSCLRLRSHAMQQTVCCAGGSRAGQCRESEGQRAICERLRPEVRD
jgi:L-aspartate oxidase